LEFEERYSYLKNEMFREMRGERGIGNENN